MFIKWDDQYLIGNDDVDRQHRQLFDLINGLQQRVSAGADRGDAYEALKAMVDFALEHFADEELFMQQIRYDGIDNHRWQHRNFASKVAEMSVAWGEGKEISANQILLFLKDWLLDHILTEDMQIGAAFRRRKHAQI